MVEHEIPLQLTGWRIPKACQECRKRKIKCNGSNPCESCMLRNIPCLYRDFVRHRKKKHQDKHEIGPGSDPDAEPELNTRARFPDVNQPASLSGRRNSSMNYTFNQSVSATNMASTPRQVQLYYGSTSHFALLHVIYRDLMSSQTEQSNQSRAEVEEVGAGLDMFSFRRIFFGTPLETPETLRGGGGGYGNGLPVMLMPYDVAKNFLGRFLSTFYYMVPFRPHDTFRRHLDQLYSPSPEANIDIWSQSMLLMALAMGSLATEHYAWGDILFERVKASIASLDDVVNLPSVQLSLFMISV